jgi:phosphopantetheinyl transferase
MVFAAPEDEQVTALFRLWTRKEAAAKAFGLGLSDDMATFDSVPLDLGSQRGTRSVSVHLEGTACTLIEFAPDGEQVAAIVVVGECSRLEFHDII